MALKSYDGHWPDDLRQALMTPYEPAPSIFELLNPEPWPHMVIYEGNRITPRLVYVSPEEFYWDVVRGWERGPSDCTWIVPGTGERPVAPWPDAESRTETAERIANLAGTDIDGGILPPSTEGGINRTPKRWWWSKP